MLESIIIGVVIGVAFGVVWWVLPEDDDTRYASAPTEEIPKVVIVDNPTDLGVLDEN